jgi:hypothetical protein
LKIANAVMMIANVTSSPPMIAPTLASVSRPSQLTITVEATSPESANTSPWAKLMSCRIP